MGRMTWYDYPVVSGPATGPSAFRAEEHVLGGANESEFGCSGNMAPLATHVENVHVGGWSRNDGGSGDKLASIVATHSG